MCYESRAFQIDEKRVNVYRVEPAKVVDGWRRKWCRVKRQFVVNVVVKQCKISPI